MQPAYIISAYKRPDLLFRLVAALEGAPVAVHVDAKSPIFPEVAGHAAGRTPMDLLPRHVCHWGLFGHVAASIEGLRWFLRTGADYAILLTGQCYPLRPQPVIAAALARLGGRSVMEIDAFPRANWMALEGGGTSRIDRFHFKLPGHLRPRAIKPWTRRLPYGLHPYGGGGYWCLARAAAAHIIEVIDTHSRLVPFFRSVLVPDEVFFHTILGNSPFRDTIENRLIHYTDWSGGGASPAVLTATDLPAMLASDAWFARKFEDAAVLDRLDRAIAQAGSPARAEPAARAPNSG